MSSESPERTIAELLGRTELFRHLGRSDQALVAREMGRASFEAGQTIFSRGDPGTDIYLVVDGRVRLSVMTADGRALSFRHACAGSIFGEIAALDGGARTADATALTRVVARTLSQAAVHDLMRDSHRVSRAVVQYLCGRLRDTSEQAESIALHPLAARVARLLLQAIERRADEDAPPGAVVNFGMSQSEMALLIGGSRQKVNAALARLEAAGAITRLDGQFVCDVVQLKRIAAREE